LIPPASCRPTSSDALLQLLSTPGISSKRWIYRQFDYMVRTNTIVLAGLGAAVVRVKGTNRALAMSVDGNGRFCQLDPRQGARLAVAEASRNVACAGGEPIGATNCLNFGNPERPEMPLSEVEKRMGFPRDYLDFTTWYLKSKKYITKADNSDFALTAEGVDFVEANNSKLPILNMLLKGKVANGTNGHAPAEAAATQGSKKLFPPSENSEG